jgi:hypothetical protein
MASFYNNKVTVYTPDAFTVEWELNNLSIPATAIVSIFRSEASEGPWTKLREVAALDGRYSDKHIAMGNLFRTVYYKLICTDDDTDYESESFSTFAIPDAKTRYMLKMLGNKLRQPHNSDALPVYFYTRRTWGPLCECSSRGKTSSSCPMCFGTGFLHGFYEPIMGYVSRSIQRKKELKSVGKNVSEDIRQFWTMPYPLLNDGDFFVSALNDRWRILPGIDVPEIFDRPLRQKFYASQMSRGDIIYQIEVPKLHDLVRVKDSHKWKERAIT